MHHGISHQPSDLIIATGVGSPGQGGKRPGGKDRGQEGKVQNVEDGT